MANSAIVKEEIEIKDEICESLTIGTTDPNAPRDFSLAPLDPPPDIRNSVTENDAKSLLGTDNNIPGLFSTETVGSKTLVVFRRLPGPLSEPIIPKVITNKSTVKKVTECDKCGEFVTNERLQQHLQFCSVYLVCQSCPFKTKDRQSLTEHCKKVHSYSDSITVVNECQKCRKTFKSPIHLKYHASRCKINVAHYCDMCPYRSIRKSNLTTHIQRLHNIHHDDIKTKKSTRDGQFIRFCSKCSMIMNPSSTGDCITCRAKCHWKCKQCSKIFSCHRSLMYHLETQCNSEGYYDCPQCQFKSRYFGNLRNHVASHSKLGSTIDLKSVEWKEVAKDANGVKLPMHPCSTCDMTFAKTGQFNCHILTCGKTSILKSANADSDFKFDKDNHLRMTYGSKKIVQHCKKCDKDIEGDRYFYRKQCEICQTKVKFRCKTCGQLFVQYTQAVEHLNSTCYPRGAIQCNKCDFMAYDRSQILEHHRVFHGDIPMHSRQLKQRLFPCKTERSYQCAHCPYKGKFKGNIRNHLNTCHVKQPIYTIENCISNSKDPQKGKSHKSQKQPIDTNENSISNSKDSQKVAQMRVNHFCFMCNKRKLFPYRLKNCEKCKNAIHLWCTTCDKAFAIDNPKACEHIKACLDTYTHECERCSRYFNSVEKLMFHVAHHCGKKIIHYSCSFCATTCCNEKNLLRHVQRKHSKNSNQQVVLTTKQENLRQVDNFTRSDLHAEKSRGKKRDFKGNVLSTFKKEKNQFSFFSCQKCNAKFVKNTDYSRHLIYCEAKLNLQCKVLLTRLKMEK